jgi:HemY protein
MVVLFAIEWLLRRIFRTGAHTRGWFVGRKRAARVSKPSRRC